MMDVMGVSEALKIKLTENGYTSGRVIGSGCTMFGNPVRDIHLAGGEKKITQEIINNYINGISVDYECKLKTFDNCDDFCIYVKMKNEEYELLCGENDCEPTEDEECIKCDSEEVYEEPDDEEPIRVKCCDEPKAVFVPRVVELNIHKNCLLDVIGRLSKSKKRVHEINIEEFSANYYRIAFEYVEEV